MSKIRDRDFWGYIVRSAWIKWARSIPGTTEDLLVPYDELCEQDKECGRMIAEAVLRQKAFRDGGGLEAFHTQINRDFAEKLQTIKAILDEPHIAEDCDCVNCSKVKAAKPDWQCDRCGYRGEPACLACTCHETSCGGKGANQRGSCCPHGFTACPVCDGGEADVDVWAMVKRIREAIEKGATK